MGRRIAVLPSPFSPTRTGQSLEVTHWFAPVSELSDILIEAKGRTVIDDDIRRRLETYWLREKLFRETS
jgi:hypothetical protein